MTAFEVNSFINAAINVFMTMLGAQVRREDVYYKRDRATLHDVTGTITLMGSVMGSVAVSMDEPTALRIACKFIDMEFTSISSDVTDAIGELVNMVVGSGKTDLATDGVPADISVPQVIIGKGHHIWSPPELPCVEVQCNSDLGPFALSIRIKKGSGA